MTFIEEKPTRNPFRNEEQFIFIGQSGAGKDYILRRISDVLKYPKIVSHTTRPPRPHEVAGVDYHFAASFNPEVDPYVEYRQYETVENGQPTTWYYWLTPDELQKSNYLGILDYEGAKQLQSWSYEYLGFRPTFVYVWASNATLEERASQRPGYEEAEFKRRLAADLKWQGQAMRFSDIIIYNDAVERLPRRIQKQLKEEEPKYEISSHE